MIYLNKNKDLLIFIGIILCVFFSSLTYFGQGNSNKLNDLKTYFFQEMFSMDIGLSDKQNMPKFGSPTIIRLLYSLPNILEYKFSGSNFERFDLDLGYLEWQQILKEANSSEINGTLIDSKYVKAKIRFREQIYNAKVRLKGYGNDHREGTKRYSLMISLSGDETIFGSSKFAIQKPATRFFPFGYLYQLVVEGTDNLVPTRKYAHIFMNGENWGIMNLEESFTKELLEKQKAKESIIIRFPHEFDKNIWTYNNSTNTEPYPWYRILDQDFNIHLYNDKKYLKNSIYRKYFSYIQTESLKPSLEIFDIEKLSEVFILSSIWGSWHSILDYNLRYYFNPYTLKLEPMPTDQLWPVQLNSNNPIEELLHYKESLPKIFRLLAKSKEFEQAVINNFDTISLAYNDLESLYTGVRSIFSADRIHDFSMIKNNIETFNLNKHKFLKNDYLFNYTDFINSHSVENHPIKIASDEQAAIFENHIYARHYSNGVIELHNLLPDEVQILDISYDGLSINNSQLVLRSYLEERNPYRLETDLKGIRDYRILIETEYRGFKRSTPIATTLISENMVNPLSMNSHNCQNMCTFEGGEYFFKEGSWLISDPINFDGNVHIPANTNFIFGENAYLIIKGALFANGKTSEPITFLPESKSWKGIYVLNASNESRLENVHIAGLQALSDGILNLTGGINFYKSDVIITDSFISKVFAEDALNVVKSNFSINNLKIEETVSDGIDSDFSEGEIKNSFFREIKGDALDFSGSTVLIANVNTFDVFDKAISAGEQSNIVINSSQLMNSNIGITSKDGSYVEVFDTSIKNYKLYGVMSYEKKNFYSKPAAIELMECTIDGDSPYLRQTGSMMIINNKEIQSSSFDVEALYSMQASEDKI